MTAKAERNVTLDGLRGVAACLVAVYHAPFFPQQLVASGYLGVDLFFVLSGYVIAQAYESRFAAGLTPRDFLVTRLIRLYPVYLVGLALGLMAALARMLTGWQELNTFGLTTALLAALVYLPSLFTARQEPHVTPLNGPAWSLSFELLANVLHVLFWRWLTAPVLLAIAGASALGLTAAAVRYGNLDIGWQWTGFEGGLARVLFSYAVGVLIFRWARSARRRRFSPWLVILPVVIANLWVSDVPSDLLCVLLIFPAAVWLGVLHEPEARWRKVFSALGDISYPLYAIHLPIYQCALGVFEMLELPAAAKAVAGLMVMATTIGASWLLARLYDEPVRAWLTDWRKRSRRAASEELQRRVV